MTPSEYHRKATTTGVTYKCFDCGELDLYVGNVVTLQNTRTTFCFSCRREGEIAADALDMLIDRGVMTAEDFAKVTPVWPTEDE